jgi:glycosyltransferase involved in cell wall biosynthesis
MSTLQGSHPAVLEPIDTKAPRPNVTCEKTLRLLAYVHLRNIYNSTGAGRVARQLTEHLAKRADVALTVLADSGDYRRIIPQVGSPWDGFGYRFIQRETSRQQALWFLLDAPTAERYLPGADVVFCTAESYVPKERARLAVTVHDAAYFEHSAHRRDRGFFTQRFKWRLLYRKLDRRADLFHAVSDFSADRLAHFFPSIKSRIRVVHNAVTPHFFAPVTEEGKVYMRAAGLENRRFVLLPGGLHYRKNAELILQAWPAIEQLHRDVLLVVVNHSNPEYVAKAKGLGRSIKFAGFVPDSALRALYGAAELVWFPSRYEGFGLPVVEAMAAGTPVVASNSSSLPEIAAEAALLAGPADRDAHVQAIDAMLRNARLRGEFSLAGQKRAQRFTWTESARQLKEHFDALI